MIEENRIRNLKNVDISRPPKAIQGSENKRERKCHNKQDPRYSFDQKTMEGKQTHTFDGSNLSLSCPCSSPLSVVILKEEIRTPSFSLPSGKNNEVRGA